MTTFGSFADGWLAAHSGRVKPQTIRRHRRDLDLAHAAMPELWDTNLNAIDDDTLELFVAAVERVCDHQLQHAFDQPDPERAIRTAGTDADAATSAVRNLLRRAHRLRQTRDGVLDNWQGNHVTVNLDAPDWLPDPIFNGRAPAPTTIPIDRAVAPLIRELWRLRIGTEFSCQGVHNEQLQRNAWINFGDPTAAQTLLAALASDADTVEIITADHQDGLISRIIGRSPDAWEWHASARLWGPSPLRVHALFPPGDITLLTDRLQRLDYTDGAIVRADGKPIKRNIDVAELIL